jgi:transcriptional regulator with XRE-family HTH domain
MKILKDRIKQLRKEKEWSQEDLARAIGATANQISRYETCRIVPSIETLAKLAQAFDVTSDYLIMENASRKPFRMEDIDLLKYFEDIQNLTDNDKKCIFYIIDAFIAKNKIKSVAQEIS